MVGKMTSLHSPSGPQVWVILTGVSGSKLDVWYEGIVEYRVYSWTHFKKGMKNHTVPHSEFWWPILRKLTFVNWNVPSRYYVKRNLTMIGIGTLPLPLFFLCMHHVSPKWCTKVLFSIHVKDFCRLGFDSKEINQYLVQLQELFFSTISVKILVQETFKWENPARATVYGH